MKRTLRLFLAAASLMTASAQGSTAADRIVISAGAFGGVYYAVGDAICRAVIKSDPGAACAVEASAGSTANIMKLDPAKVQFAIVQSDVQFNAMAGRSFFSTVGADKSLRVVMSLHEEAFTVLVRANDPARTVGDLKGRKFSAGNLGTGTRETAEHLFEAAGWTAADRKNLQELPVDGQVSALCAGTVDAVAYLVGHPAHSLKAASQKCAIRFIPIADAAIAHLVETFPYYLPATVPGGLYQGNKAPVKTVGTRATLMVKAGTPERLVYDVLKATMKDMTAVKSAVPALSGLQIDQLGSAGITAPLHPGALKVYKEFGIATTAGIKAATARSPDLAAPTRTAPALSGIDTKPAVGGPSTGASRTTSTKPAVKSVPVGKSGAQIQTDDIQSSSPSLGAEGEFSEADKSIQLKIPMRK